MDLSTFKLDEALPMTVKNPQTGEDTDIKIFIHHPSGKVGRNLMAEYYRNAKEDDPKVPTDDYLLPRLITKFVNLEDDGKAVKYSISNATKMLEKYPWLLTQIAMHFRKAEYTPKP